MKFLGFVNSQSLELVEICHSYGNYDACLIVDNDSTKELAIKLPSPIETYALYQWDWDKVEKCDINKIVTDKVKETYNRILFSKFGCSSLMTIRVYLNMAELFE